MKNYKVEISKTFCIDVKAKNEEEAKERAEISLEELEKRDKQVYSQTGDTIFMVYDVTDTDDFFEDYEKDLEDILQG
jgi:uncharacterized membrane protein